MPETFYLRTLRVSAILLALVVLPITAMAQVIVGPGFGGTPEVQLIESGGTRAFSVFYPWYIGGVNVTLGDVNADGTMDVIAAAGSFGGPHVRVFNGTDLSELASFYAFDPSFVGGVRVAAGDVNGDGRADIITATGPGGGPQVRVFSGLDLSELANFYAYHASFTGGVTVAAGDVNGDGLADIVTGAGPGGGPHVRVFSGADLGELASFYAYDVAFTGGVTVAAGDFNGDGLSDIVTGAGPGGGPHVRVFSGLDLGELASFYGLDPAFSGGVGVAAGDIDADGRVDLILGAGPGGNNQVRILSGVDFSELDNVLFPPGMGSGVSIGSVGDQASLRFTSPATTTFTAGSVGTFTVTTAANPVPTITSSGALPAGVTFVDNLDGTATLAGTPAAGTGGTYALTFTADNGGPTTATQNFTLTVNMAPAITSAAMATFPVGAAATFSVTTTGFPVPTIAQGGATLPSGITWVDNGDGTGTLSGTAAAGTGGTYALTFTASNGVGAPVVQTFTLTVNGAPVITSANATTFTVGSPGSFTVTTVASPTAAIGVSGALPAGVTFVDNGDGTGTLSGTPAAGTGGTRTLTFLATNGILPNGSQTFTLTVNQAAAITSGAATGFTVGTPGSFTITTTGFPVPTLVLSGAALPSGVTFTDNGDGTATLSGTPAAGTTGTYALIFTATGSGPAATQNFTLTISAGPTITSAAGTTFTVGSPGTFTVTTTGSPTPSLAVSGSLPSGVTFLDNGNGTGTLSGTPAGGTGGSYAITFTATNGVLPNGTQAFTLNVNQAPAITSAASATFTIGVAGSFPVTTSGFPAPSIAAGGVALPSGLTFVDNGNGTGTLSGTAAAGTGGTYAISFTATNATGSTAPQAFTLTVSGPPSITSATTTTFTVGAPGSFTVTAIGSPTPALTVSGSLPAGVTFTDNGDGTGTLSGTPAGGTGGSYALTFTAANGVLPNGTQAFTLNVNQAPAITSAASTTFTVGAAGTFTLTTSGFPLPSIARVSGGVPAGLTFVDNGNGTGTLSGTPAAGTGGTHVIFFTATNTLGTSAPQAFTLTVSQPPAITSAAITAFTVGVAGSFTVTTTGFPTPAITRTGVALPGGVTFTDNGDGTGTLSGTPAAGTFGSYAITFTAANGALPDAVQAFTLTVQQAPAITSGASTTFTVGTPGTFTVTTTGFPTPTVSQTGTLPTGVTFTTATRVLAGTATQTGAFPLVFTATNGVSPDATQNFTLNVVCPAITVTPLVMPDGLYQTVYAGVDFNQTGSTGTTFTWGATGLPAGLTIDANTGVVSGTATNTVAAGPVVVTVTDNFGCPGTLNTSVTVRPTTDNENYTGGVGNTQYVVGAAVPATPAVSIVDNVKNGDNGPGALSVSFPATSPNGAIVEGATDGTFIYTPNVAFAGPSDTFTYTLTDGNGVTNTGTVTINLSDVVWYVNSASGAGDGRSHNPFNTLSAAGTPSGSGSYIYVHTGSGPTSGNLTMDAPQILRGQGANFSLNGLAIPGSAPATPTLTGTVTLANQAQVVAVNFAPSGAIPAMTATGTTMFITIDTVNVTGGTNSLSLTNHTGSLTLANSTFTNATGAEVLINGGAGNLNIQANTTISSNAGRSIDIQNRTGGTIAFSGPITDTGQGIFLNANTGATINFTGGLSLTTTTNPGFTATGGGTVSATQNNTTIVNTITTTTGTALNVANTTIGASGLTFRSISANGAANGIVLSNTATSGGLTVTGNGGTCTNADTSGCSGGRIRNTAGADDAGATPPGTGIVLNSTLAPSLTRMWIHDHSNFGIRGTSVPGFTMANTVINGVNGNNDGFDEGAVSFTNLTGSASVTDSFIGGAIEHNMQVLNSSGTLNRLTISGTTFGAMDTTFGSDGLLIESSGTAVMNVTVNSNTFTSARGDHFQYSNTTAATAGDVVFTNNTITNAHPAVVGGGGGVRVLGGNNTGQNGNITFNVSSNSIQGARGTALAVNKLGGTGTYSGTIANNVVGATGVQGSGSLEGSGIFVLSDGGGTYTASITGNNVRQYDNDGIFMQTGGSGVIGSGTMNLTVTGNTVTEPETQVAGALATNGFHLNGGTTVGDTYQICLQLSGNTLAGSGQDTIPAGSTFGDFRLRQRQSTTVRLPGYAGSATDAAAAVTFVQGLNPGGESGVAAVNSPPGGGFVGGAACPIP